MEVSQLFLKLHEIDFPEESYCLMENSESSGLENWTGGELRPQTVHFQLRWVLRGLDHHWAKPWFGTDVPKLPGT